MASVSLTRVIEKMKLENLTPEIDVKHVKITQPDINRPALQLAGYFEHFDATRLQIIGFVEYTYMEGLTDETRREAYEKLMAYDIPCIVFSRDLKPDPIFLETAIRHQIPVLSTKKSTSDFMSEIIRWLNVKLAPCISVHGVLVDVYGEGVLITGESGIGKSEAALELIRRGHRLVTDDVVELRKVSDDTLVGSAPDITKHFIELRGIGIVDVKALFGALSVKDTQTIDLVIRLEDWDKDKEYDRLGLEENYTEYLGNKVVCHNIPIRPGRNLAVICETAAINHRQKKMGYNAAKELYTRVQNSLAKDVRRTRTMSKYAFGVDVGGTTVKLGLFNDKGQVLDKWEIPTVKDNGGEKVLPDIAASIKNKMQEKNISVEELVGVGIGAPGAVDADGYMVNGAVNIGWGAFDLAETLKKELDLPVTVKAGNDANVAALGEMWQGGGKGYSNLVAVTLGTGVGGGIIIDGRILTGTNGAGGEIGHIHIEDAETETCGCKNKGCLEQYASATGVTRLANRRLAKDDAPSVLRGGEISAKTVFDAVKAGDKVAIEIAEQFGEYLGKGLAVVANVVDPQIFVIGGGVSKAGDILFKYIEPSYKKCAFGPCKQAKFALATLGNDAGIYGAAALVLK